MPLIAVLQMNSGVDPAANLAAIANGAGEAAQKGARVLFTPEMSLLLDRDRKRASAWIESDRPGEAFGKLQSLSDDLGIDIALGSAPVSGSDERWANRSVYFRAGETLDSAARYDKIHMFDVELSTGETWCESNAYAPGRKAVAVEDTPLGRLGLTICYDLRFPALFDALGRAKCDCISTPAAFTVPTGEAHWHILVRARAIEASAFVVAAAQVGEHEDGRRTYGHSLVVDPWGDVLLDMGGEGAGLGFAEIDLQRLAEVREQVPSLANRREIPN